MPVKVAFFDVHTGDEAAFRKGLGAGFEPTFHAESLSPATAHLAGNSEVVSVWLDSRINEEVLAKLPQLRHLACRTSGYDHVDLAATRARDVLVTNAPAYAPETIAEYAFLLTLAISRKMMLSAHAVQFRNINPEKLTGRQLHGKTLGLVGAGHIGRAAAAIGRGFGMTVLAYDTRPNEAAAKHIGFRYADLSEVLARADYLQLHAPAQPGGRHLLGPAEFAQLKPGVFIVNTARGSLIDSAALLDALQSGRVAGAGLDVVEAEEFLRLPKDPEILDRARRGPKAKQIQALESLRLLPNVLVTSHNASNSQEAIDGMRQITVSNIVEWKQGNIQNEVP
jgi:D-lactate dehydrogenase